MYDRWDTRKWQMTKKKKTKAKTERENKNFKVVSCCYAICILGFILRIYFCQSQSKRARDFIHNCLVFAQTYQSSALCKNTYKLRKNKCNILDFSERLLEFKAMSRVSRREFISAWNPVHTQSHTQCEYWNQDEVLFLLWFPRFQLASCRQGLYSSL